MAADAIDIDINPETAISEPEKERQRKHKKRNREESSPPPKKKRKQESGLIADKSAATDKKSKKSKSKSKSRKDGATTTSSKPSSSSSSASSSPYVLTSATMYLPLPPISISPTHALASLEAEHLSPLLLTYYAPFQGIILAYSNASISSTKPSNTTTISTDPNSQTLTLAKTAGEYGILYVYLTATFLIFRPEKGQVLEGWVNVQSEGFLGAVVLNLFSVGIERKRLPSSWKWVPPGEEVTGTAGAMQQEKKNSPEDDDSKPAADFNPEKELFNPVSLASDANSPFDTLEMDTASAAGGDVAVDGFFQSISGHQVRGTVKFRVVDVDIIPGSERNRGFLSIEGTMLSPEEEAKVFEDERNGVMPMAATPRVPGTLSPHPAISNKETKPKPMKEKKSKSKKDRSGDA